MKKSHLFKIVDKTVQGSKVLFCNGSERDARRNLVSFYNNILHSFSILYTTPDSVVYKDFLNNVHVLSLVRQSKYIKNFLLSTL